MSVVAIEGEKVKVDQVYLDIKDIEAKDTLWCVFIVKRKPKPNKKFDLGFAWLSVCIVKRIFTFYQ